MSYNLVNPTTGDLTQVAGGTLYADLPIGSWVKNDMGTLPSGFLKEGDTISQSEYPELYAKYGSTVPYKADMSELGVIETVTLPMTAPYDGELIPVASNGGYTTFSINGSQYTVGASAGTTSTSGLPIKKGDVLALQALVGIAGFTVRYYKKSLIVKAKQVALPVDFKVAIDDALSEFAKPVSLVPLNNSSIFYDKSRIVGGIVTICADIIIQSGSYLTKENAVAKVPNLGTASIGYILPCLYRNTGNGAEEPSFAIIATSGNIFPYYTRTEYNEIRINASYSSKI